MNDHQVENYLPKPWPQVGRVIVVAVAIVGLIISVLSFVVGWEAMMTPCMDADPTCPSLTPMQIEGMERIGISLAGFNMFSVGIALTLMLVYFFVAGLILWRRPDSVISLFTALLFAVTGSSVYSGDLFGLIDRFPLLRFPAGLLNAASFALLILFLCLFPNGRFTPTWTRWLAYILTPYLLLTSGYYGFNSPLLQLSLPVTILALVVSLIAQIIRYRRYATPKERQQTKWFLLGATLLVMMAVILAIGIIYSARLPERAQMMLILGLSFLVPISLLALPISIGISLLRYQLWDIDIIIRKTLVYSLLTAVLGLLFLGSWSSYSKFSAH